MKWTINSFKIKKSKSIFLKARHEEVIQGRIIVIKYIFNCTQDVVMTAAHCCVGQVASDVRVVAGDHNLEADEGTEQVSFWHLLRKQKNS